jgi:hypothetical protein
MIFIGLLPIFFYNGIDVCQVQTLNDQGPVMLATDHRLAISSTKTHTGFHARMGFLFIDF